MVFVDNYWGKSELGLNWTFGKDMQYEILK
jgi:hypothetical protein